jgi:predicted ATPase
VQAPHRPRFGTLLREFRLAAGLTQEALAERATMSAEGISALERGANQAPQRETLGLLVNALHLTTEQRRAIETAAVRASRPRRPADRERRRHNLPRISVRLYGRDDEIESVKTLLSQSALVTLIGTGGVGKTSLALKISEELLNEFDDGVWFIDLARIRDPNLVPSALAAPFGIREAADRPLTETLVHDLHRQRALLLFDNCEHVADGASALIQAILAAGPSLCVLATSRQPLNLPGETTYRVASLDLEAAIAFFADFAARVTSSFELSDANRGAIARIVTQLDGIALAIELAAARLKVLSPEQLEERLSERFRVLTGGSSTAVPRQQTMRAAIDWSYDLLNKEERALFQQLGVFSGGFFVDAAPFVCSCEGLDEWRVVDLLASLVDQSLVVSEPRASAPRFCLLESMRAYALEKVEQNTLNSARSRHAQYYTTVAERAQALWKTVQSTVEWAGSLEVELENFRAALAWTFDSGADIELGARLLTSLQEFWIIQGLTVEALRYAQRALEHIDVLPVTLQAALWLTLARMQHEYHMAPSQMLEAAFRACELYDRLGEERPLAMALRERGNARLRLAQYAEAENDLQRSLAVYRELGDVRMVSRTLASLGFLRQIQGEYAEAREIMLEVLHLSMEIGDDRAVTALSLNICENDFALGDVEDAVTRARSTLLEDPLVRKSTHLRAGLESNLAAYLFALGREEEARATALQAIRDADYYYTAVPIQHLSAIIAPRDPRRAATLLGYVEKVLSETHFTRQRTEAYTMERLMNSLHAQLDDDEISRLGNTGHAMSEEQAIKIARRSKLR